MKRRAYLVGLAAGSGLGLSGCLGSGSETGGRNYDVGMGSSSFEPKRVEVAVGDTVVWRNTNSRAHTVTAYENAMPEGADYFASGGYESEEAARDAFVNSFGGAIASRDTFEHAFTVPGEYGYFCIPHERGGMVGTVVVTE